MSTMWLLIIDLFVLLHLRYTIDHRCYLFVVLLSIISRFIGQLAQNYIVSHFPPDIRSMTSFMSSTWPINSFSKRSSTIMQQHLLHYERSYLPLSIQFIPKWYLTIKIAFLQTNFDCCWFSIVSFIFVNTIFSFVRCIVFISKTSKNTQFIKMKTFNSSKNLLKLFSIKWNADDWLVDCFFLKTRQIRIRYKVSLIVSNSIEYSIA